MSMLFAYMGGGEGVLEILKCFVRGVQNFSTCFVCVCVYVCVCMCVSVCGKVRFSTSPSVYKITDPPSYS